MRHLVEEVKGEGLEALLGKKVLLMCCNYFYTGTLVGVNTADVKLADPKIVYETGQWTAAGWADAQAMGVAFAYVRTAAIESYAEVTK